MTALKALLSSTAILAAGALIAAVANAAPIVGDVGVGGSAYINTTTETVDVIGNTANVLSPGGTGDLSSLFAGAPVSFADFGYGGAFVPLVLWSSGGFTFTLATLSGDLAPAANFIDLAGDGELSGGGFDATPYGFTFSADLAGGNAQWRFASDVAAPVPEPLPIAMLGAGLIALGIIRKSLVW